MKTSEIKIDTDDVPAAFATVDRALREADPGEYITYFRGLVLPRTIQRATMAAHLSGACLLVQRADLPAAHSPSRAFEYIMVKPKTPPKRGAKGR